MIEQENPISRDRGSDVDPAIVDAVAAGDAVDSRLPGASTTAGDRLVLLLPCLVLVAARIAGTRLFPIYDDAFITYRYARNLVHGRGFVYNAGEWVLGVTAPLFAMIPALLEATGLTVPPAMVAVNMACDIGVLVVVYRLLKSTGSQHVFVWFGLLYAASPVLTRISVGGMEADLFVLASVFVIYCVTRGALGTALVAAAVASWLRPEGIILVVLVATGVVHAGAIRATFWPAVLSVGVLLLPCVVLFELYGSPIPQSVAAKAGLHSSLPDVLAQLLWPDPLSMALIPVAVWGAGRLWKAAPRLRLLLVWDVVYIAAYVARRPAVWSWYAAPTQSAMMLFAAFGIADVLSRVSRRPRWSSLKIATAGSAVLAASWTISGATHQPSTLYQQMRQWIAANDVRRSTVLAMDIGAIGYYSDAYMFDAGGLVWRDQRRYQSMKEMIVDKKPDYVMLNLLRDHIAVMSDRALQAEYELCASFPSDVARRFDPNPARYSNTWRHEYVVFRRRDR